MFIALVPDASRSVWSGMQTERTRHIALRWSALAINESYKRRVPPEHFAVRISSKRLFVQSAEG